jgi:hypothetical protein
MADALISLYKLKIIMEDKIPICSSNITKRLRPLLSHRKRNVRKFAGLCINTWHVVN